MKIGLLLCLMLAQVNVSIASTPAYTLGGVADNWMVGLPRAEYLRLMQPIEIPATTKVRIELRHDLSYTRPEMMFAGAMFAPSFKRRLVLVNVEETINVERENDRQYRVWPHLGLLSVGTVAHQQNWEVVLWDELVQGPAPLEQLVRPGDVVGLSVLVTGMERSVGLAERAKQLGARYVIAGNDAAMFRVNQLLALPNKPFDAVFTSNNLTPLRKFFRQATDQNIEILPIALMHREPGARQRSNIHEDLVQELAQRRQDPTAGDVFIVPEFQLFSQAYYDEVHGNYRQKFGHKHRSTPTNALAQFAQGCTRAAANEVCWHCDIGDVANVQLATPSMLEQMVRAYQDFGIDTVFNVTDSAYEMRPVALKLQEMGTQFNAMVIYGRAWGLANQPELLDVWMSLVSDRLLLNVGMESGDENILQGMNKAANHTTSRLQENYRAIEVIRDHGAHLHYSLIIGNLGETIESCERSMDFLEHSLDRLGPLLDQVESDIFWFNYGAPVSRILYDYEFAKKLSEKTGHSLSREVWQAEFAQHSEGLVVPWSVEQAWYRYFTSITVEQAQEYNERIATRMAQHTGSVRGRAFKPSPYNEI